MNGRTNITLSPEMQRRAQAKANELSISLEDYVRVLVAREVGEPAQGFHEEEARGLHEYGLKTDISIFFDLIDEGPPTNIARDKDKLVGEAVWQEFLHETGRRARRRGK